MDSRFDNIIFFGTGDALMGCMRTLLEKKPSFDSVIVIEYGENAYSFSRTRKLADEYGIRYHSFSTRTDEIEKIVMDTLLNRQCTLLLSINNKYIFSKKMCTMARLAIVNCHTALLPRHPGANAPTWTIFEGDDIGGITWHYVDEGIDTGCTIKQYPVRVDNSTTALQLTKMYTQMIRDSFDEVITSLLTGNIEGTPQPDSPQHKLHKWGIYPNNGEISPTDDILFSERVLRSMDFGNSMRMPYVKISYGEKVYDVLSYRLRKQGFPERQKANRVYSEAGKIIIEDGKNVLTLTVQQH